MSDTLTSNTTLDFVQELLGDRTAYLLEHECKTVMKEHIHAPGPDFIDRVWTNSNRSIQTLRSLQSIYKTDDWQERGIYPFCQ